MNAFAQTKAMVVAPENHPRVQSQGSSRGSNAPPGTLGEPATGRSLACFRELKEIEEDIVLFTKTKLAHPGKSLGFYQDENRKANYCEVVWLVWRGGQKNLE